MKGRNPNKAESKHMDRVSQLGCIVCRNQGRFYVPCEIHHIEGKTKKIHTSKYYHYVLNIIVWEVIKSL